ncbi:MAG: response regulator [Thermoproteota archaeon]|jgi:CheY-like chemotaxis protein|nr:response regulator [Thermoproteota archaeon]
MRVLIAEDDKDTALLFKKALEKRGHNVTITHNGEDCLKVYHEELQNIRLRTDLSERLQPFDAVVLDYKMPRINGMDVAKEILAVNQHQRIIFASAYVKETLVDSIKQLKQVVELMQKPFGQDALIDTIEDKGIYSELQKLNVNVNDIKAANLRHEQIREILNILKNIQKGRTF